MAGHGPRAKSRVTWDRKVGSRWPPYPLPQVGSLCLVNICELVWVTLRVRGSRDLGDTSRDTSVRYLCSLQGMLARVELFSVWLKLGAKQ